jgi:xylulokinase
VRGPLLLGIDVGTGGCKAVLVSAEGAVAGECTSGYPLATPRPLWSEQDPGDWWAAAGRSAAGALERGGARAGQVAAVGLSGQMHGLVLLDGEGGVLRPAILWNDQRCAEQCESIHRRVGRERLIEIAGKPALPGFTAPKVLWVADHEPEAFARARAILLPKDYVRWRLTGRMGMDAADASGTLLLDVRRRRWSEELLDALRVPRAWLPDVVESSDLAGAVSAAGAAAAGLVAGTPVVAGAGDQAADALGSGTVEDGQVSVTVGTSGVVFVATGAYRPDPAARLHAYCHAVPGRFHLMGVMLSAGGSLRWLRDAVFPGESYDALVAAAERVPAGSEGLVFLPYLSGERSPHADPHARGAFVGLTLRHGKGHLVRAVLEGVAFGLRDVLELVRAGCGPVAKVRLTGGAARSAPWRRILADVFQAEVATVNSAHGAAYGAALLAGAGAGIFAGVEAAAGSAVRETGRTVPGPGAAAYDRIYPCYRALYPALRGGFRALSGVPLAE